ncbi:metallophosphoesterase family protein [Lutimaribacter sp. EGI FJ00015]|uniref:Metallophosphoesterase family protein n=1 Tax=Lutimaribacter degradans TaxID=2945989 RepID=A0ACC5ZT93_9RHOB|nr:metallophosphoesterase [Lutimaribacter sp. EGI FJ00013]MCM2561563.1 metallophosphoesterase family protein [Lutimaribacter sp. EGI FJ00013]MCO0612726.1 metallophosphoesterase family protein [Lutimaribacter sp. EGI FJ00015]MCO0635384.1 metallophosphoesterase family protein [Lutimaribacter sp. EGI FJ00014]
MHIMAFSDLHMAANRAETLVEASTEADLVIGAGDFCNMREGLDEAMEMLQGIMAPMIVVPGNAESAKELRAMARPNMTVLHGESTEHDGLCILGLGYGVPTTPFGPWSCDLSEDEAASMLAPFEMADLLVTHSPPRGVADITSGGQSVGSVAIHDAILRIGPKLVLCGHIHDSWGKSGTIGDASVHNLGPTPNWFEL